MAECQSNIHQLTHRYREQARSHILIFSVLVFLAGKKMPRTWRGIFMGGAYRPSSMALLRTAPLSALVASRA